jgi:ubiquinone/menaquinone biosynthesis C-methylase UbiE
MRAITNYIDEMLNERDNHNPGKNFEDHYVSLRQKEGRIYPDEVVKQLPFIGKKVVHHREWKLRAKSATRLVRYLEKKKEPMQVLEVGCGNGWLSHMISLVPGMKVHGIDINKAELQQAKRVFSNPGLEYIPGDPDTAGLQPGSYDQVIFAASLQYFSSLPVIIDTCSRLLKPGGEIQILDTHFYTPVEIENAKKRSAAYYRSLGVPALSNHYFHHSLDSIEAYPHKVLYCPSWWNRFFKKQNPFTWYCLTPKR